MGFALLGLVMTCQAGFIHHNFDAAPFLYGTNFLSPVSQWQASDAGVTVVSNTYNSAPQSVLVPSGAALSNDVASPGPTVVWTELAVAPCLGDPPDTSALAGRAFVQYFDADRYLHIWTTNGWLVCSNDVWGSPVAQVTAGVFANLSIYQNFTTHKAAVMLNDQVVLQDLPFLTNLVNYGGVRMRGADGAAWLDDVSVTNTYDAARHSADRNGMGGTDAAELQQYGYVARTQYVGAGQTYTTLAAALAVARDRDVLYVTGAGYAESVTVTQNLTIVGSFTNSGTITLAAGATLAVAGGFTSSLSVSGTLAIASGVVVSGATVTVAGTITVAGGNAQLLADGLAVNGSGTVVSSGGTVSTPGTGMTGTFTLDNTWGGAQVAMGLDFNDDFDSYTPDTQVTNLGFRGWASTAGVVVKAGQGVGNTNGVVIASGGAISNKITSALQSRIWTDCYLSPVPGEAPAAVAAGRAFAGYVGADGFLYVWTNNSGWAVCSNYVNGSAITAMSPSTYMRVTAFLNFNTHLAAIFIDGKLAREQVSFPAGAAVPSLSGFRAQAGDGQARLDSVQITTRIPAGMTADLDGDGIPDALEIETYDTLNGPAGSVFLIR